jgi:hypothetical protein
MKPRQRRRFVPSDRGTVGRRLLTTRAMIVPEWRGRRGEHLNTSHCTTWSFWAYSVRWRVPTGPRPWVGTLPIDWHGPRNRTCPKEQLGKIAERAVG